MLMVGRVVVVIGRVASDESEGLTRRLLNVLR